MVDVRFGFLRLLCLAPVVAAIPSTAHAGDCSGISVAVDNDDPGSGYSEVNPENFQTHNVDACAGTYRYLSQYVGDESTNGRVIWQPSIEVEGTYRVTTSFRASENRTDDADYLLIGDDGQQTGMSVDQRGDGCAEVVVGEIWCVAGGSCRLELDGTDDAKSDAADQTVFELVDCEPPPPSPCDPLIEAGFEVCGSGPTQCEGVYSGGEGCLAYCATVGMMCIARFGGEPGCMQEALEIPCAEVNDHASDYCVCEGEPPVSTTGSADNGADEGTADTAADSIDPSASGEDSGPGGGASETLDPGESGASSDAGGVTASLPGADTPRGGAGCSCTTTPNHGGGAIVWGAVGLMLARRPRRRAR